MQYLTDFGFVAAIEDADGHTQFVDDVTPLQAFYPGKAESLKFWRFEGTTARLPTDVGGVPTARAVPGPGGAYLTVACFPPRSQRRTQEELNPSQYADEAGESEMHWTDSIDLGLVVSGKMDLKIPGGEVRTLSAGTPFVIAGAKHAWSNPYGEPCIFTVVAVGVRRAER